MSDWLYISPEDWTEDLKILKEKTDKNILITYLIESSGYWPLLGDRGDNMLELIHNYSHPDNKIWYVNGDGNAESNYNDWYELVKPKMRINMYPLVPAYNREVFVGRLRTFRKLYHPVEDVDVPKKYRVITMINQPKISRILTLRELAGQPGFIYSFNATAIEAIGEKGNTTNESFMEHVTGLKPYNSWGWTKDGNSIKYKDGNTLRVDSICDYNMSNKLFDMTKRINFKTPFVDGFENDTNAFHDFLPVQEWLESEMDLVCETHQIRQWHFSEKTCKPLGFCKPFLVIGCAGWYKIFEKLGFKLYDELFDYSFDEIESFRYRHKAIMTQMKDILNMDKNILKKKLLDIKDKIHYNKRHLLECRDDADIFKIAKQIDDIS
jgi:hypothetical protein